MRLTDKAQGEIAIGIIALIAIGIYLFGYVRVRADLKQEASVVTTAQR